MTTILKNSEYVIRTFSLDEKSLLKANFLGLEFDFSEVKFNISVWDRESRDFTTKVKKSGGDFRTDKLKAGDILLYEAGCAYRHTDKIYSVVVEKSPSEITLAMFEDPLCAFQFSYAGSEEEYLRQFKINVGKDNPLVVGRLRFAENDNYPLILYRNEDGKYNVYATDEEHFVLPQWYDAIFDTLEDPFYICVRNGESIDIINLYGDETEATGLSALPVFLCRSDKSENEFFYSAFRNGDWRNQILIKVADETVEVL